MDALIVTLVTANIAMTGVLAALVLRQSARIDALAARVDEVEQSLSACIDALSARIDALAARVDEVERSLTARIDHVAFRVDGLAATLGARIDQLFQRDG